MLPSSEAETQPEPRKIGLGTHSVDFCGYSVPKRPKATHKSIVSVGCIILHKELKSGLILYLCLFEQVEV